MMIDSLGTVNKLLSNPVAVPANMELKNREVFLRFNNNNEVVEVNELLSFYPNPYISNYHSESKYFPPQHIPHLQSFPTKLLQSKDVDFEAKKISYLDFMRSTDTAPNERSTVDSVPRLPSSHSVKQIDNANNKNLDGVPTLRDILKDAPKKPVPAFNDKSAKVNTNYFAKTSSPSPKQGWGKPPEGENYARIAYDESKKPVRINYPDRENSPLLSQQSSKPPSVNEIPTYLRIADSESKKPGVRSVSPVSSFGTRSTPRSSPKLPVAPPLPDADKANSPKIPGLRPQPNASIRSNLTPRSSPRPPAAPPLPDTNRANFSNITSVGSESSYSKLNLKSQTYPQNNADQTYNTLRDDKPVTIRGIKTSAPTKMRGTSDSSGVVRTGKIWKPPAATAYPPRDQLHAELLKARPPIPPAAE